MRFLTLVVVLCAARGAAADEPPFATRFDPGNRLMFFGGTATAEGPATFGGGLFLRHTVTTDDPGVTWRFEHAIAQGLVGRDGWRAAVYQGRYLRHSRDGHIVLPTNPPRKIFLHSDLGFEVTAGAADTRDDELVRATPVRAAIFADYLRASDFRRRFAVGLVARWDLDLDRAGWAVAEHRVAPLTLGAAALHLESASGLTVLDLTVEGGAIWSNDDGFGKTLSAAASVERIFLAVNDLPLSVYLEGAWDDARGARLLAGLRFAVEGR